MEVRKRKESEVPLLQDERKFEFSYNWSKFIMVATFFGPSYSEVVVGKGRLKVKMGW